MNRTHRHLEEVMGTIVTIDLFDENGISRAAVRPYLEEAVAQLHRADAIFSTWAADSPMSRIRRGELAVLEAPPEVHEVLERCAIARELSDGWFDPWSMPGGVDPTGLVKGWAAQRAADVIAAGGVVHGGMVNAAGDIASFGGLGAAAFRVGIADPASPRSLACILELKASVATSGTYERGSHLVDPHTGCHEARVASATVAGPDLALADALATALAVGGEEVLALIEAVVGYEGFVIGHGGAHRATSGFPFAAA